MTMEEDYVPDEILVEAGIDSDETFWCSCCEDEHSIAEMSSTHSVCCTCLQDSLDITTTEETYVG